MLILLLLLMVTALFGCDELAKKPGAISGTVLQNGAGVNGVTVTLTGTSSSTATTDAKGDYFFTNLALGTYSVSPSNDTLTSDPESTNVTLTEASPEAADVNFEVEFIDTPQEGGGCDERVWKGDYVVLSFLGIYPLMGYTEVTGNLTITGTAAFNLRGLDCLKRVGGNLTIAGNAMTDLSGLDNLESVGRNFTLTGNAFATLHGLEKLKSIGGTLTITTSDLLSIKALSNVTSADNIIILANPILTSLEGLNGITRTGNVTVMANPLLINTAGLEKLTTVDGFLLIRDNPVLSSLGLKFLESVAHDFAVVNNYNLCTNLAQDLADSVSIGGSITISSNKACP
jgi:hypothetical protein